MSIMSVLDNIQNTFANTTPNNLTTKEKSVSQNVFEKALNSAILDKGITLPSAAGSALPKGLDTLSQATLNSSSVQGEVFEELGLGIAGAFAAALAGDDSATAITPVAGTEEPTDTDETADATTTTESEEPTDTDEIAADTSEAVNSNTSDTEKALPGSVESFLPDSKAASLMASSLSSIESLFLGSDDKKDKDKDKS